MYEATQRQRKLEREIRSQKRKILIDEAAGDKEKLQTDQIRYQVLNQEYRRFNKAAGLRSQQERANVAGFGPKQAKAAEKQYEISSKAVSASPIFVQKDDRLAVNAKKIKPVDGFEDVVVHGDENGFYMYDKEGNEYCYSPAEFSKILKQSANYHGGAIRLISCNTGAKGAVSAQQLADILGVEVLAPSKTVFVDMLGNMTIGDTPLTNDGKWITLEPKR